MEKGQALSVKEKMAYGCGDAASNMMWGMTSSYLMYYYIDKPMAQSSLFKIHHDFIGFDDEVFFYGD